MNSRILTIGCGIVVIALVVLFFASPYIQEALYVDPEPHMGRILQRAQKLNIKDVEVISIDIETPHRDHYFYLVTLKPETDKKDIERLLSALKTSWVVKEPVRVPGRRHWDWLKVRSSTGVKGGFDLHARFDPSIAPLVSNRLRSNTLSKVVQDIVKRKGEKRPVKTDYGGGRL